MSDRDDANPNPTQRPAESWGSRIGVILAVMGSAVGLGNFLRFPGLAAQYEGGAFMIPYFVALLLLGLPLAWGEWAMGRFGGRHGYNSAPGIYRAICRHKSAAYIGVLGLLVPVVIYMYYVLIESWCLAYAWFYLSGTMADVGEHARAAAENGLVSKQPYEDLFARFTGDAADGSAFTGMAVVFLLLCFLLNFLLIYRGIKRGIEKFCLVAMPALIVCALLVLLRVLTLPHVLDGLGFMWNPRGAADKPFWEGFMASLSNPKMWLDATGQIFFSLSVGFGIIITYASYLRPSDDIALSSLTSAAGNEFCEVALGGLITIPAAFIFLGATAVTAAAGSSFNLGFKTLPMVFESMPLGHPVGFLFFFLLFLAAVTSSLSMLQPAIALLEEGLGINRRASVAILGFITLVGSCFTLYFSQGTKALGTLDAWVGTFFIYLPAIFQTVLFGWVLGVGRGMDELDRGAEIRVPRIVGWCLKYVAPIYLLTIFVAFMYSQIVTKQGGMFADAVKDPVVGISVGFIVVVTILFLLIIAQSVKRWERQETQDQEVSP
jgi:neurotransmitter:Na+ symporter, NSS family